MMNKKSIIQRVLGLFLLQGGVAVTQAAAPAVTQVATPQNILFIAVDDLKPVLGCYGDELIQTPNIDRLATQGTVFLNAHCQQAICGPSRASLMTGLRPDKTEVWDLKTKMRDRNPDILSLPQYFRSQGFTTAGTGKIYDHRCVDKKMDEPSWSVPFKRVWSLPYPKGQRKPFMGAYQSDEAHALAAEAAEQGLSGYVPTKKFLDTKGFWPAVESADVPDTAYDDGAIAAHGIRMLQQFEEEGNPFFLAVGFKKPHLPFVAPKKYWDLYERDEFKIHPFQKKSENPVERAYHTSGELRSYGGIGDFDSY